MQSQYVTPQCNLSDDVTDNCFRQIPNNMKPFRKGNRTTVFSRKRIPRFCSSASAIIYEAVFHTAEPTRVHAGAEEKGPHHGSFSFNLSICGFGFEVTAPRWKR